MTARHHDLVAEFTRTFGHPIFDTPTRPDRKLRKLRTRLMREEYTELVDGIKSEDVTEVADGLGDMAVIGHGTLHAYGLPYKPAAIDKPLHISTAYWRYQEVERAAGQTPGTRIYATAVARELNNLLVAVRNTAAQLSIPFDAVFEEICDSNMSKLGADGRPIYRADAKIQKGPNYFAPRLAPILVDAGLLVKVSA